MFSQIELPQDSMIVGRNQGHVTSRAKRVKYKAEVEAILSLSQGVIANSSERYVRLGGRKKCIMP